jgi:hypothetical protein
LLALAPFAIGCDHPAPAGCGSVDGLPGTCAIGEACASSLDCDSSNCASGTCAESCTSASDCAMGQICLSVADDPGTRRYCSSECPMGDFHVVGDSGGLVCFEGRLQPCIGLADPGSVCDVCRCASGARCYDPAGIECRTATPACECVAPQPVGGPCTSNVGCLSFNCSGSPASPSRHCEEPAGTTCDASTDCVHCDLPAASDGHATCRQSCERDADCGTGICIALGDPNEPACYADCTLEGRCNASETCTPLAGDARNRRYCAPNAPL